MRHKATRRPSNVEHNGGVFMWKHGTTNGYTNYGCRCPECKRAMSEWHKSKRVEMGGAARARTAGEYVLEGVGEHGTVGGYALGCRCNLCREAVNKYHRDYRRLRGLKKSGRKITPINHGTSGGYNRGCRCDPCREAHNKHQRDHRPFYKTGENTRIAHLLRCRILAIIDSDTKAGSAVDDLGCTIPEFRAYLESQFQDGMTWENHGCGENDWSIDHIKPLNTFDLSDRSQFLEACHYTNMRPLWHRDNMKRPYDGSDIAT